jgi:hypothetical protein
MKNPEQVEAQTAARRALVSQRWQVLKGALKRAFPFAVIALVSGVGLALWLANTH